MGPDRDVQLLRLATVLRSRLVAVARRAGAGADAEDAVQDVLARLATSDLLPADERRAAAYAATAVRRRALELARPAGRELPDLPDATDAGDDHERRRALRAFAQAVEPLPERARAVLVLDAAGWRRADVAAHLGLSPRVVKRLLDEHRGSVVAAAAAAVGGADCDRFAPTLAAYAGGMGRPRPDGPVARHLEVCDACRLALVRARALRALFPPPGIGLAAPAAPAASLTALKLGAAVVAAVTAAGVAVAPRPPAGIVRTAPPVLGTISVPAPPAPVVRPRVRTVQVATRPRRQAVARVAARPSAPAPARRVTRRPPRAKGACDLGTLGICGLR